MDAVTHEIIEKIHKEIYSYEFKLDSKTKAGYFTRESPLSFETMMIFMLKLVKKSMQIELNDYFDELQKESFVSKQAFSKARKKIRPEAFEKLFRITYETGKNASALKYYKEKYRLLANDGTSVALEGNTELIEYFGSSGGSKTAATARVSVLNDVCSGVLYDAIIDRYSEGERKMALRHLKRLKEIDDKENILLWDRGYVSEELIAECCEMGHYFVMRIRDDWHKKLADDTPSGDWGTIKKNGKAYPVRIIKLTLPNGNSETLFSNIDFIETAEFDELYALRWTVETKYDTIKNLIQLENASGMTVISILQDFWACMTIANIMAFAKLEADVKINKNNEGKELKREYQANNAIILGMLRRYFVLMIAYYDDKSRLY